VVELLEGRKPPGLFLVLDDVCATLHGGSMGADADLKKVFVLYQTRIYNVFNELIYIILKSNILVESN